MARPSKSLEEHVRAGTFRADRHAGLLDSPFVRWKRLRVVQAAYQAAVSDRERRAHALAFADEVRRMAGQSDGGVVAVGDMDVAEFFPRYLRHTKGPLAGQPFHLEDWQADFVSEFYRRDDDGRRIYRLGILGVPRGNGKSPLAAGLGLFELVTRTDSPDVFVAAGARDQARITFNFARAFVEQGDLANMIGVGRSELVYPDRLGSMRAISADGYLQHGHSVSAALIDELHSFSTEKQGELFLALESALHKRLDSFLLAITTAGSDRGTLLGRLYDRALADLELERPHDCLTIGRDEEHGVLFWWYAAPEQADLDDEEVLRRCNPASWVSMRDLRRQRHSPGMREGSFRRLHWNQWTAGEDAFVRPEWWAACKSDQEIADEAEVFVGVDASFSGDATAVAWAHKTETDQVVVRAHVWSALSETPAHVHLSGGKIDLQAVEDFVLSLAERYYVREVVFDPAYFARSAEILADQGLEVAPIDQRGTLMRDAYSQFHEAVNSGTLCHDGDSILRAHVLNAGAHVDAAGHWKVRKIKQAHKIDGLVAAVLAFSRAAREPASQNWVW